MKDGSLGLGRMAWSLGLDSWFQIGLPGDMLHPVLLPNTGETGGMAWGSSLDSHPGCM